MKLKNKLTTLIFAATVGFMSLPCLADIVGTVTLPGGDTPEQVTVLIYEHSSPTSSGYRGAYTVQGNTFTIPTKKGKDYRFEIRGEKNGIEYYTLQSQIPNNATLNFPVEKVYPIEVRVQDTAGNLIEAYVRSSWDKGYRGFSNWANDGSHTIYNTQFKAGNHTFKVEAKGYKPQTVTAKVSQYRTPVTVTLEPLEKGYTLTGRIRYEDGTPVESHLEFLQGGTLHADAFQGKFYVTPVWGGAALAHILPVWNENGQMTLPNLLSGNYETDVIFEKEGKAYHIYDKFEVKGNLQHDFVARPTNVLKVIVKDPEGNYLDRTNMTIQRVLTLPNGQTSQQGKSSYTDGPQSAIFPDLEIDEYTVHLSMLGYKAVEQKVMIKEGMNELEIILEK